MTWFINKKLVVSYPIQSHPHNLRWRSDGGDRGDTIHILLTIYLQNNRKGHFGGCLPPALAPPLQTCHVIYLSVNAASRHAVQWVHDPTDTCMMTVYMIDDVMNTKVHFACKPLARLKISGSREQIYPAGCWWNAPGVLAKVHIQS